MNQKGQALVEFLLLIPIMFVIMLAVYDFGNILYHRYKLENNLEYIADLYMAGEDETLDEFLEDHHLTMDVAQDKNFETIYVKEEISILTPGLKNIIGDAYRIDATKVVYEG